MFGEFGIGMFSAIAAFYILACLAQLHDWYYELVHVAGNSLRDWLHILGWIAAAMLGIFSAFGFYIVGSPERAIGLLALISLSVFALQAYQQFQLVTVTARIWSAVWVVVFALCLYTWQAPRVNPYFTSAADMIESARVTANNWIPGR